MLFIAFVLISFLENLVVMQMYSSYIDLKILTPISKKNKAYFNKLMCYIHVNFRKSK